MKSGRITWLALAAMIVLYAGFFGYLSLARHNTFQTNALDLGYTGQTLWNTAHGRPFQFSTYEGAQYHLDIPLQEFRRRDILLSYHVEPLLLLIAPLLRLIPDLRGVLLIQTLVLGLGAVPAYLLARKRLKRPWLALVFPAMYLLAPSIAGANLSDFHAVAFSPLFLLSAYVALDSGYWKTFGLFCFLALLCKEDIALLVVMLGLYAALFYRPRWVGMVTAATALLWFILATQVIAPAFNGLGHSPFLIRYNQFGTSAGEILRNMASWPSPLLEWFLQPAVLRYGLLLTGMGGGIVLLGPQGWVLALPVVAANSLSNYEWMHSGGGHYSASVVAFLIIGAVEGASWLDRRLRTRWLITTILLFALGIGLLTHWWAGVSPVTRNWSPVTVTEHHRALGAILAEIPAEARVTAQSALYPHVALRRWAFLFPTNAAADVIALDVTSTTYPWSMNKYHPAVEQITGFSDFQVVIAHDGVILSTSKDHPEFAEEVALSLPEDNPLLVGETIPERGPDSPADIESPEFTAFALATVDPEAARPVVFEGGLVLDGYTIYRPMAVTTGELPYQITTYWHITRSQMESYHPVLFFRREDGALAWAYDEGTPTDIWFPTDRWLPGQQIKVSFPPLDLSRFSDVLIGVLTPSGDTWTASDRLQVIESGTVEPLDEGTLVMLFDLQ